jgi:hypothetical protein
MTPEQYTRLRKNAVRQLDIARGNLILLDRAWQEQETKRICDEMARGLPIVPVELLEANGCA